MGIFARYDIETFMTEVEAILKANINDYIAVMNSDKGGPDLPDINDDAYYIQTLNDAVVNYDDFVFIFEESVSSEGSGPFNSETYNVVASIVSNVGNDQEKYSHKRLLRYREILKRIIQEKWSEISRPVQISISSLSPFGVSLLNSSNPQMGVGVSMEVSFA